MECKFFPCSTGVRCDTGDRYSIASINSRGQKRVRSSKSKNNALFCKIPFLRGVLFFIYGLIAFFTGFDDMFVDDVTLTEEQRKSKIKSVVMYSVVAGMGVVLWVVMLGFLPAKLSFYIMGYSPNVALRNLLIALFKGAFIYVLLVIFRFLPMMVDLYRFNGACNIMQEGKDKNILHMPLNFLNFVVFSFIFSIFVITLVGASYGLFANCFINLGLFVLCVSISFEILILIHKSKKLRKLCVVTSYLVVIKPNTTHLELARSAYLELASHKEIKGKMKNDEMALSLIRSEMETKLSKTGNIESSDIDWIIATVLRKNRAEIRLVRSVSMKEYREIMKATEERAKGKPLSAIFGFVDFYGFRFSVNKKVLSPRMETELLVESVIKEVENRKKCKVLDVGTGSGAIAISVAKCSSAEVTAVDISRSALEIAKQNMKDLEAKVTFLQSDLFAQLKKKQKYDIIVSNPPYIRSLDIEGLDVEVKNYDPRLALDGGDDGLDFYRKIIAEAPFHFNNEGMIFFELGKGQFTQVKNMLTKGGFTNIRGIKDYNKIYRIVKAEWKK